MTEAGGNLLAGVRDAAWLQSQAFPPTKYAVPGVLPEGLGVLVGPPKAGKSWLVLDWLLGMASANGLAMGGIGIPEPRNVLYLALEDGDKRMRNRISILLGEQDEWPAAFHYETRCVPGTLLALICEWFEYAQGGVVVVDTLGKALPDTRMGESPYARDYRVMSELKAAVDNWPGATLLLNHHDRKAASADFVDSVSGTNGIAGAADTVIALARDRQNPEGLLQVTGRDVIEGAYAISFRDGSWTLDGGSLETASKAALERRAEIGLGDRSREILEFVVAAGVPVSPKEVAEGLRMSNNDAGTYLRRMVEAGRLFSPSRGRYTPLYEVSECINGRVSPGQSGPDFQTPFQTVSESPATVSDIQTLQTGGGGAINPAEWNAAALARHKAKEARK